VTQRQALVVSPHPDDEVLGCGATITLLRDAGWRITNLACSLGRPAHHERRNAELIEASARLGIESRVAQPLAPIGSADDEAAGVEAVHALVSNALAETDAELVISPQLQDLHHGHEIVAAGVRAALIDRPITWWMYGLWHELVMPTLYVPFDDATLATVSHALDAYEGENARNHFDRLYPARAIAAAVQGSERIFGFGAASASTARYAELFTEVVRTDATWHLGVPRILDVAAPFVAPSENDFEWWMIQPTTRQRRAQVSAKLGDNLGVRK
jgi:LmbE family N-acetylglucosaminyl deacetylase